MRTVAGEIAFPPNVPDRVAKSVLIEIRDVSYADAPSTVVASSRIENVHVSPGGRLPFELQAPELSRPGTLAIRVHVDWEGDGRLSPGDLLTTESISVPAEGNAGSLKVPVKSI